MSSLKLYIVESDEDDRGLGGAVPTKLPYKPHLYTGGITFLAKPGCFVLWQRLQTALAVFWRWPHPYVRPVR